MSQPVLVKVYGHIYPATGCLAGKIANMANEAYPEEEAVSLEGDLLTISFEGISFPVEEVIEAIRSHLSGKEQGKVDYIDLENWKLTRWLIRDGSVSESSSPLNNVLAWSGH